MDHEVWQTLKSLALPQNKSTGPPHENYEYKRSKTTGEQGREERNLQVTQTQLG